MMTRTAWELNMLEKLAQERNVRGARMPKSTMIASQAMRRPNRSSWNSARRRRRPAHRGDGPESRGGPWRRARAASRRERPPRALPTIPSRPAHPPCRPPLPPPSCSPRRRAVG
jgi:hypothetical protein